MILNYRHTYLGFLVLSLSSCYPTQEILQIPRENLLDGRDMKLPAKIHLLNGSMVLCNNGFTVRRDTIWANGLRLSFSRFDSAWARWAIPLDSVAALEYFDKSLGGGRAVGSVLLGATVTADIAIVFLIISFASHPLVRY